MPIYINKWAIYKISTKEKSKAKEKCDTPEKI
jgi:hypothetical protein